jgi:hypothetical protein
MQVLRPKAPVLVRVVNRTAKRLLVNLVGSTITSEHRVHWLKLEALGLVERRPITDDAQHVIRTADGESMAKKLKLEDPSLVC